MRFSFDNFKVIDYSVRAIVFAVEMKKLSRKEECTLVKEESIRLNQLLGLADALYYLLGFVEKQEGAQVALREVLAQALSKAATQLYPDYQGDIFEAPHADQVILGSEAYQAYCALCAEARTFMDCHIKDTQDNGPKSSVVALLSSDEFVGYLPFFQNGTYRTETILAF